MKTALALLIIQGSLGAFDTLWYHEWQARLPSQLEAQLELRLHAARGFIYTLLFATLGWVNWSGLLAWILLLLLLAEIFITLWDFIEEDRSRRLAPGERITHTIMGINYGAFLAFLLPELIDWTRQPSGFFTTQQGTFSWILTAMSAGIFLSAARDLLASYSLHSLAADNRR